MRNLGLCTRKNVCCWDLHSDLANRWSFPQTQSNKNTKNITNNNSFPNGAFVFHILIYLCAQTGSDIRNEQLFRNIFQNFFFRAWRTIKWLNNDSFLKLLHPFAFWKCSFVNSTTQLWNTGKKPWEKGSLAKLGGLKSATFSHGPVGSPLSNIFQPNFSGHILTEFRIQCDISSSNQTGAIPTATFQNGVSTK